MSEQKTVQEAVKETVDKTEEKEKRADFQRRAAIVKEVVDKVCNENNIDLIAELRYTGQGILPVPIYADRQTENV